MGHVQKLSHGSEDGVRDRCQVCSGGDGPSGGVGTTGVPGAWGRLSPQPAKEGPLWAVSLISSAEPGRPYKVEDQGHGARLTGLLPRKSLPLLDSGKGAIRAACVHH